MKITDVKCTVMGQNPVVRITTDAGIDGLGQAENAKPYLTDAIVVLEFGRRFDFLVVDGGAIATFEVFYVEFSLAKTNDRMFAADGG